MSVHIRRKHKILYMSVRYLGIKNLFSNSQLKQFHNVYKIQYLSGTGTFFCTLHNKHWGKNHPVILEISRHLKTILLRRNWLHTDFKL